MKKILLLLIMLVLIPIGCKDIEQCKDDTIQMSIENAGLRRDIERLKFNLSLYREQKTELDEALEKLAEAKTDLYYATEKIIVLELQNKLMSEIIQEIIDRYPELIGGE